MREAAQPKDDPADLINVASGDLVRARCEPPGPTTTAQAISAEVKTESLQPWPGAWT
ncbi:hypothetical protein [Actinomadura spongiicola]|uniref:hypothetical protein n=1 Tax=Actinomadura spongiicola TaxID=2303421 RepID=UPI0013149448|nr:hypothetical protein [Actinomadura spongiicola]